MEIENLLQQESIAKDGTTPYAERIFYYNPEEESQDMYNSHTREVEQARIEIGRSHLDQHHTTENICALAAFSVTNVHSLSYNHSLWIANVENTSLEPYANDMCMPYNSSWTVAKLIEQIGNE